MKLLLYSALLALTGLAFGQDCSFEGKLTENPRCGWSNDLSDDFDWRVTRFPTRTPFTGPSGDHTTGLGNYIYTEANGEGTGNKARLYSPIDTPANIDDDTLTVVTFWYSMFEDFPRPSDPNMGTLNVYIEYSGKVPTGPVFWSRTGAQSPQWKEAKLMFRAPQPFRIIFEGVIGAGDRSDIGIDDVTMRQTEISSTCDFDTNPIGDLCTFNQEDLLDDFDWTRQSGETPTLDTGPLMDNTFKNNTGHYMFIETTRQDASAVAMLTSFQYFKYAGGCTVEFYYHAFGVSVGQLNVVIRHDESDRTFTIVDGVSEDAWKEASVTVPNAEGHFTVTFEGSRGDGNSGDIAIDDISLLGSCFGVDHCASNPCKNGGVCTTSRDSYECECLEGLTGLNCEEDCVDCTPGVCPANFECIELINDFDCVCPEGFQGENCEPITTPELPGPIDTHVGGVNPEMIPVIIGSCVGAFILFVTAVCFTATCINQDGYRTKGGTGKDAEGGPVCDMYVNDAFDADDDGAAVDTAKGEKGKDYAEISEKPSGEGDHKEETEAVKASGKTDEGGPEKSGGETSAFDNKTYVATDEGETAKVADNSGATTAEDGKEHTYEEVVAPKGGEDGAEDVKSDIREGEKTEEEGDGKDGAKEEDPNPPTTTL